MNTLETIFRHNLWANLRLFEECSKLTDEQLDTSIIGVFGSIRKTLLHIVRAEQGYFSRISTGERFHWPEDAPQLTIPEMVATIKITGDGLVEWASKIQATDTVQIDWDGILRDVPKTIILNQVINHATEHRSQVMSIMTQIGIEPPDISSWSYFDELENK